MCQRMSPCYGGPSPCASGQHQPRPNLTSRSN
jgi:hypothetical protein